MTQAWGQSEGAGITVAVLGTGVDASYPSLAGSVITGPDYSGTAARGRDPGGPFWGVEGTAVASLIAGHGHGPGLAGVAPAAKILSVRVTLEFNDPLASDQAISRRLAAGIADRHQVRGRSRRPDHRPAARPRDAGPDRPAAIRPRRAAARPSGPRSPTR